MMDHFYNAVRYGLQPVISKDIGPGGRISPIQKIFTGHYIDFRKVCSVSEAYSLSAYNNFNHNGIGFDIYFEENPEPFKESRGLKMLHFSWEIQSSYCKTKEEAEQRRLSDVREFPGHFASFSGYPIEENLEDLRYRVKQIIDFWKETTSQKCETLPIRKVQMEAA